MKFPPREELEQMFDKYKIMINIKRHCEKVNQIAVFLAKKLKEAGEDVDVEFVDRLSVIHDLMKSVMLKELKKDDRFNAPEPTDEQLEMWKQLKEKYSWAKHESEILHDMFKNEYPEFAEQLKIEGDHTIPEIDKSFETQISRYADSRVFSDTIVSLQERFEDAAERYHKDSTPEVIAAYEKFQKDMRAIEGSIFSKLDIQPDQLADFLK